MMMWIDKTNYNVDGRTKIMEVPPTIVNSRTLVPLRLIANEFGAETKWDGNDRKVTIEYTKR